MHAHAITPTISTEQSHQLHQPQVSHQQQELQPTKKVKQYIQDYQELLLQFDDDTVSMKCLQWINNTPSKQLRSTLRKAKIYNNRIDTLFQIVHTHHGLKCSDLPKLV